MPDSNDEGLDEAKEQHHAKLAEKHQRLASFHSEHSGGQTPSGSTGANIGGFLGALGEHKFWLIGGVIGLVIIVFVIIPAIKGGTGTGTANANSSPSYANGGYLPSDISSALDNINQSINGLANQIGSGNKTPPPPPGGGHPPPPPPPGGGHPPPHGQVFVTVAQWTRLHTPWNSTLQGIANREHISLNRIEQLNPSITNPNKISAGQKIRVK